jgi:hypothetical protein
MTEDIEGVLFTDGRDRVFLHPPKSYPDGHGFHHLIDIVSGPFQGTVETSSYEKLTAFVRFREELAVLYEKLKGEAHLPHSYENAKLSVRGDGLGHLVVEGEVAAGYMMQSRLRFEFSIDQTHLPQIMRAIDRFFLS